MKHIAYTGLADGDLELATVVMAVSFLLSIVVVPLWMTVFASGYQVLVPTSQLLISIAEVLIGPMIAGALTRQGLVHWAIPAATLPLFQVILLVLYLRAAGPIRRLFQGRARPGGGGVEDWVVTAA